MLERVDLHRVEIRMFAVLIVSITVEALVPSRSLTRRSNAVRRFRIEIGKNSVMMRILPCQNPETHEELLMPHYTKDLLIKPVPSLVSSGETLVVTPESTGFEYLTLRIRKILRGERFSSETGACELGLVILGGCCSVQ